MRHLFVSFPLLFSAGVQACSMGFSFHFVAGPPEGYRQGSDPIAAFLNERYGAGNWVDSPGFAVKAIEVAENPAVVPFSVGSDDVEQAGRYRTAQVFVEKQVAVLDSARFSPEYLPAVYYVDGPDWQTKNSPKAFRLQDITHRAAMVAKVAEYRLSARTLPIFSIRLNLPDTRAVRMFAVFEPNAEGAPVVVVRQVKETHTRAPCSSTVYVDGPWPEGLRPDYEYR